MIVTTRSRESEILTDYKDVVIKGGVNQYGPLSFYLPKTEANAHCFYLVENENFIEYEGHEYRIKEMEKRLIKNTPISIVSLARHRFYDLVDIQRNTKLSSGVKSINELLSFIFTGTPFTFSVIGTFGTKEFENFGNSNCLDLFNKVIERFEAEFEIIGTEVRVSVQIGSFIDMQFRHGHNIKTFKERIDTNNLSTRIYGTGKLNEDGTPIVSATYISPNAHLYTDDNGVIEYKDAPAYSNETITQETTLLEHLAAKIQDEPEVSFELEFAVLQDAGYTKPIPEAGDVVPTMLEGLGIDVDLRIMEFELYPESFKSPKVVLANYKKRFITSLINYQKSLLDKIYDENSKTLRYDVYHEAVKLATEALNNSLTELEYPPNMGIIARDPNDPNRFVVLRSSGLGVTTDGGLTFKNAITADGVVTNVLTAGQIKTNNVQIIGNDDLFYWDGTKLIAINAADPNKYVQLNSDGLYIAKGAMSIERPDGYVTVNDGVLQNEIGIIGHDPPYRESGINIVGTWWSTFQTEHKVCQSYYFKHDSRYLKIIVAMYSVSPGNSIGFEVVGWDGTTMAQRITSHSDPASGIGYFGETLTVDLGVPTGSMLGIYVKLWTGTINLEARARIPGIYKEG